MTVTRGAILVSIAQLLLNLCFIIPTLVRTVATDGGPMGFGLIALPFLVPLSFCILIAPIAFLNLRDHYDTGKLWFIIANVIVALSGVISFAMMPVVPTVLIGFPTCLILISGVNKDNLSNRVLIANVLTTLALIAMIGFWFYSTR